ncbi:MAG: carboxypeptidase regulatory-like domain-containing protein [Candidatus Omnitrophica bacterium]|nr:carboxypeptidase regulatory-like domain-containing protein [Candidatus Omnitrophota bacterium]
MSSISDNPLIEDFEKAIKKEVRVRREQKFSKGQRIFIGTLMLIGIFCSIKLASGNSAYVSFEDFYEREISKENNEINFVGRISFLEWSWRPAGWACGFEQRIPVIGDKSLLEKLLKESKGKKKEIIASGRFGNETVKMPEMKSRAPKTIDKTFRVFYLKEASKINFSEFSYPDKIIEGRKFTLAEKITNPFLQPISLALSLDFFDDTFELLEGEPKIYVRFNPKETKIFKWKLKPTESGFNYIGVQVFGRNDKDMVWITDSSQIRTLALPELHIETKNIINYYGQVGELTAINFTVRNIGDLESNNISAKIILPEGITAPKTEWYIDKLIGGEEAAFYANITFTKLDDRFIINIFAIDEAGHKDNDTLWIYPRGKAKLKGFVKDSKGLPIPKVQISIDPFSDSDHTDDNGYYCIENLRPGDYTVEFCSLGKKGFPKYKEFPVNIAEGEEKVFNVVVDRINIE